MLPLLCEKGTTHCISNRESPPFYKTETMCKGKQMIVSVKIIVSILEIHVHSTSFATYVRITKVIFQLF
jgi:hypothetical protein